MLQNCAVYWHSERLIVCSGSSTLDLCCTTLCLDHIALFASLGAGTRLNILEAVKLEQLAGLSQLALDLCSDGLIGMSLRIGQRNLRRALHRIVTVRLHLDVSALQVLAGCLSEGISHDNINWSLRSEGTAIGMVLCGKRDARVSLPLLLHLDVELCTRSAIGLRTNND